MANVQYYWKANIPENLKKDYSKIFIDKNTSELITDLLSKQFDIRLKPYALLTDLQKFMKDVESIGHILRTLDQYYKDIHELQLKGIDLESKIDINKSELLNSINENIAKIQDNKNQISSKFLELDTKFSNSIELKHTENRLRIDTVETQVNNKIDTKHSTLLNKIESVQSSLESKITKNKEDIQESLNELLRRSKIINDLIILEGDNVESKINEIRTYKNQLDEKIIEIQKVLNGNELNIDNRLLVVERLISQLKERIGTSIEELANKSEEFTTRIEQAKNSMNGVIESFTEKYNNKKQELENDYTTFYSEIIESINNIKENVSRNSMSKKEEVQNALDTFTTEVTDLLNNHKLEINQKKIQKEQEISEKFDEIDTLILSANQTQQRIQGIIEQLRPISDDQITSSVNKLMNINLDQFQDFNFEAYKAEVNAVLDEIRNKSFDSLKLNIEESGDLLTEDSHLIYKNPGVEEFEDNELKAISVENFRNFLLVYNKTEIDEKIKEVTDSLGNLDQYVKTVDLDEKLDGKITEKLGEFNSTENIENKITEKINENNENNNITLEATYDKKSEALQRYQELFNKFNRYVTINTLNLEKDKIDTKISKLATKEEVSDVSNVVGTIVENSLRTHNFVRNEDFTKEKILEKLENSVLTQDFVRNEDFTKDAIVSKLNDHYLTDSAATAKYALKSDLSTAGISESRVNELLESKATELNQKDTELEAKFNDYATKNDVETINNIIGGLTEVTAKHTVLLNNINQAGLISDTTNNSTTKTYSIDKIKELVSGLTTKNQQLEQEINDLKETVGVLTQLVTQLIPN